MYIHWAWNETGKSISYLFRAARNRCRKIAASSGPHIACWSLSGVQKDTWRVHSSLTVSDGRPVTAIDCKSGMLYKYQQWLHSYLLLVGLLGVGSESGLSVYTLDLEDELLTWTRKWSIRYCNFALFLHHILNAYLVPAPTPLSASLHLSCISQLFLLYVLFAGFQTLCSPLSVERKCSSHFFNCLRKPIADVTTSPTCARFHMAVLQDI